MSQIHNSPAGPDVVVIENEGSFSVDLTPYPDSIVLTRKRRLHEHIWQPLFAGLGNHMPLNFLEIGCQEGGASTWFLTHLLGHPDSRLTAIDVFESEAMHKTMLHNVAVGGWKNKVTVLKGKSGEALRQLPLYSFDVIYLDALHASWAVIEDAILSWRLLKEGGILLFDDYEWAGRQLPFDRPKPAIDFFMIAYEKQYELLVKDYQIAIRKTVAADTLIQYSGPPANRS